MLFALALIYLLTSHGREITGAVIGGAARKMGCFEKMAAVVWESGNQETKENQPKPRNAEPSSYSVLHTKQCVRQKALVGGLSQI